VHQFHHSPADAVNKKHASRTHERNYRDSTSMAANPVGIGVLQKGFAE
jgi:hypothetical protein